MLIELVSIQIFIDFTLWVTICRKVCCKLDNDRFPYTLKIILALLAVRGPGGLDLGMGKIEFYAVFDINIDIYDLIVLIYIFDYVGPQSVAQHGVRSQSPVQNIPEKFLCQNPPGQNPPDSFSSWSPILML